MLTQKHTGWVLILAAFALLAQHMADSVSGLDSWQTATQPAFVGEALRQFAVVILGILGGKMLPPFLNFERKRKP